MPMFPALKVLGYYHLPPRGQKHENVLGSVDINKLPLALASGTD